MPPVSRKSATAPELLERGTLAVMNDELHRLHGAEVRTIERPDKDKAIIAILPADKRIEDLVPVLDKYLVAPKRRVGTAQLYDAGSFIAFANRFKSGNSVIYGDNGATEDPLTSAPKLTAVLDYHPESEKVTDADFGRHRGVFVPKLSDAWKAWVENDSDPMAQADFAAFIEDRVMDLTPADLNDPSLKQLAERIQGRWATPVELLALSRNLAVNVDVKVRQATTLNTGEISLTYDETHRDGQGAAISVANMFVIAVPVFYGGPAFRIPVRLRYRLNGPGGVSWTYILVRPDLVLDAAFNEIVDRVKKETDLPLYLGAPEA